MSPVGPTGQSGTLDSGPPLPPDIARRPSMGQMAAQPADAQGGAPGGGAMQAALERLMLAEKSLRDAAGLVPGLAPVIDATIATLRTGAAKVLQGDQGGQAPAPSATTSLGMMAGGATPGAAA